MALNISRSKAILPSLDWITTVAGLSQVGALSPYAARRRTGIATLTQLCRRERWLWSAILCRRDQVLRGHRSLMDDARWRGLARISMAVRLNGCSSAGSLEPTARRRRRF